MNIHILTKNFELTSSIKEYIENKMNSLTKFMKEWIEADSVEISFEVGRSTRHHNKGDVYYAEANIKIPGGMIRAQKSAEDLHLAIDAVKEILSRKIKKHKEKHK